MLRLWKWYQKSLAVHPVKTQVISSGLIWGFGDIAAQTVTHLTASNHHRQLSIHEKDGKSIFEPEFMQFLMRLPKFYVDYFYKDDADIQPFNEDAFFILMHTLKLMFLDFLYIMHSSIQCSLFLITFGDFVLYHGEDEDNKFRINWKRVATTSMFGFAFVGPVGHFWYEGLDRIIRFRMHMQPKSFRFVATKVALDGIIFGPLDLLVFFTYMGFSTGKSAAQVKEDVKRDFLPAFILEGGVWPVVQVVNFRFVPVSYQLLYVNFFCLLDSCLLSWIEQQQDASWKQWISSFLNSKEQKIKHEEFRP